jgi:hypothetical protein
MPWSFQCPIVTPESKRLTLTHGRWLEVRQELNTGEHRKMVTDQYKETALGNGLTLDLNRFGMSRVLAYVLGWSFVDREGQPLPFSESALNSCDFDITWQDILTAVDAHHAQVEAELEARKNGPGDASKSSPILPSPSGATGDSTGSVN